MHARWVALCLAIAAILALPGAALASTLGVSGGTLTYAADAGEALGGQMSQVEESSPATIVISASPSTVSEAADDQGCTVLERSAVCEGVTKIVVQCSDAGGFVALSDSGEFAITVPATFNGGAGDDGFQGGLSADRVTGGGGRDSFTYVNRGNGVIVTLDGVANDGDPTLGQGAGEGDNVAADVETLVSGSGSDVLAGDDDPAGETFFAGTGDDRVYGGGGDDSLWDGGGDDQLYGGEGDDSLTGAFGGNELLDGGEGNDTLVAGEGNDELFGGAGNDTITGGEGDDELHGGPDDDVFLAVRGTPTENSGFVDSIVRLLVPTPQADGADVIGGGDGTDTVDYSARSSGVTLAPDDEANDGEGGEGDNVRSDVENLIGGVGPDSLTGSSEPNAIQGNAGDDVIEIAGGDPDAASCGAGSDTVTADGDGVDEVGADCETVDLLDPPDTTPPQTTIDSGPEGATNDATPTFAFSSNEEGSTFECRFDADPFGDCSGPGNSHTPENELSEGQHTFEVRATDAAGNADPDPATRTFTVASDKPGKAPPPGKGPPEGKGPPQGHGPPPGDGGPPGQSQPPGLMDKK